MFGINLSEPDVSAWTRVDVAVSRDDNDYQDRMLEMRAYCANQARAQWTYRAPMSRRDVFFLFEDDNDAVVFKLRYG